MCVLGEIARKFGETLERIKEERYGYINVPPLEAFDPTEKK